MSIEYGASGRRSIQVEAEVPGSPEQVWEAIATGPGIGSWFYPAELEERVGGVLKYDTQSETVHIPAKVTVWDPPRRFRHDGQDCGPGGPPTATDWTIEPHPRGRCLVRVVHSLFVRATVTLSLYLYGDGAATAAGGCGVPAVWQAWVKARFP